jgi:hypothetical protein
MTERQFADFAAEDKLSRRSLVGRATFFGAAMAAIGDVAQGRLRELQRCRDRFARQ